MLIQPTVTDVRGWADELDAVGGRLASQFPRSEPRRRAVEYLRGLLERKNGRQLAEKAGDGMPYGVPAPRRPADWDADRVRDDLVAHGHLADPRGVLVVDDAPSLRS